MNAVYNHRQQKLFTNALSCLARFSEKINLRCTQPGENESGYLMRLSAINGTSSAFCAFCLFPDFFDQYHLEESKRKLDISISNRTLQNVLKTQLNRKLERCELLLIEEDVECRLAIRLHSFNGVTKTHKLTFEEQRCLFPSTPEEISKVIMDPKTVQTLIDHFGPKVNGEISLVCRQNQFTIKSRNDDFAERGSRLAKAVWTEISVERRYFKSYHVEDDAELTFAMKEFKAAVALADHLTLPIELNFSRGGQPLMIKIQCPAMVAQIYIATSPLPEGDSQAGSSRDESMNNRNEGLRQTTVSQEEERRRRREDVDVEQEQNETTTNGALNGDHHRGIIDGNAVQSGQHAINHGGPLASTLPMRREGNSGVNGDQVLFFGQSSKQEGEDDDDMDAEELRLLQEAEARHRIHSSSRQIFSSMANSSQVHHNVAAPVTSSHMEQSGPNEEETHNDLILERDEEEMLTDEEEIPSTQREADAKKSKYQPLFPQNPPTNVQ